MKSFVFSIFLVLALSLQSDAQRVGNGGNLTDQQVRSILQKFFEAIQFSVAVNPWLYTQLASHNPRIYSVNSVEYTAIKNRILILPSKATSDPKSPTLCLVAQFQTFEKIAEESTFNDLLDNMTLLTELPKTEQTAIKSELTRARDQKLIPPQCQFEKP